MHTAHRAGIRKVISCRQLLKQSGAGVAAGLFPATCGKTAAPESTSGKTPISLIIDDGAPVDPMFYEHPGYKTPFLVPGEFTKRVTETSERFDLRGKFTVIPMPSCLGRIDQSLKRVPQCHGQ